MNRRNKKLLSIFASVLLLVSTFGPTYGVFVGQVSAQEFPSQPSQPDQPDQPDIPTQPDQPDQITQPTQPGTEQPSVDSSTTDSTTQTNSDTPQADAGSTENTATSNETTPAEVSSGNETEADGSGDASITTGDANAVGAITNDLNINVAAVNDGGSAGIVAENSGNASGSDNGSIIDSGATTTTDQDNSAVIKNNADILAESGDNTIKDNTGGDVAITTGDANTALTVVNQANTNIAGADIVEFNFFDDQVGDILLDFENPCGDGSCVAGTPVYLANKDNASDTKNTSTVTTSDTQETFQNNDATIENYLTLESDSGGNTAKDNTNGDVAIETGDANVSANVVNMANNNFASDVVIGIVNIFGDLVGDIIIPEGSLPDSGGVYAANIDNASGSTNFASVDQNVLDQIIQENTANIDNNIILTADTGSNKAKDNTGGDSSLETGNISVVAQVLNIANTNIVGGDWWVVLVNEAGNWVGKIFGGQEGMNYAGSEGTEFLVNADGSISAVNSGNASDSVNTSEATGDTTNTVKQTNTANITNNLNLTAVTGGNTARDNTGGDTSITTGDANVVASVVNFLNNNVVGDGRLFVSVVNVFGSWIGDFISPGYTKDALAYDSSDEEEERTLGGISDQTEKENSSSHDDGGNVNNDSGADSDDASGAVVAGQIQKIKVLASSSFNQSSQGSDDESTSVALALDSDSQVAGDKVFRVNLAWLIFLLPPAGFVAIRKRKRMLALANSAVKLLL